jgi:uncharacterized protein (DUF58 family)
MALQRQVRLRAEGVYYALVVVAVLTGAIARQLNLLMLVGSLLAGPWLFAAIYGRLALRLLRIERKLPTAFRAGERLAVEISVSNERRWLRVWGVEVEDMVRRDLPAGDRARVMTSVFFPMLLPGQNRQVAYTGSLPQRGRYIFGPLRITTRFPMGLFRHSYVLRERESLVVHPRVGRLARNWSKLARETPLGGRRIERRGLLQHDFYGMRDWRTGDSRRLIHWRTSARRGSLVVREFEQRRSQDLALLIDLWQPQDASREGGENVERAVSFVASIIDEACREPGRQLTIAVAAQEFTLRSGAAGPLFLREHMDALAVVAPHTEPDFPRELGHALANIPPGVATLVISTRPVELDALAEAASDRDARLDGRSLQVVHAGPELAQYFSPSSPA